MATGFQENSEIEQIDALLSRGGMDSMLLTIWLIIGAVTFGIMVDDFGLLNKLITPLLLRARTVAVDSLELLWCLYGRRARCINHGLYAACHF